MKKKIIATILTGVLAVSTLSGCTGGSDASTVQAAQGTANKESEAGTQSASTSGEPEQKADGTVEEENVTIHLAVQPSHIQPFVADKLGYFEEEGLDVEISVFSYGPPIIEAFTAGDVEYGFLGDTPAYSGIANGVDIQIIGSYETDTHLHGLVARNDSGINTLADLKGKTFSVPFGSNTQPLANVYIEEGGLTEADVEIVNLNVGDAQTSILNGDIDAAIVWEPYITTITAEGNDCHLVADGYVGDDKVYEWVCPIIANGAFAEAHPQTTAKLLRSFARAAEWADANPEEAGEIVSSYTEANASATALKLSKGDHTITLDAAKIDSLRVSLAKQLEYEIITKEIDLDAHINTKYLELAGLQ